MTDRISILTARGDLQLAKTWMPDGTVKGYDKAKNFSHRVVDVEDIHGLSRLLTQLEPQTQSCIIRGGYIGDDLAVPIMRRDEGWTKGAVLRQQEVFKDRNLRMMMVDVDKFTPTCGLADPVAAIDEFIGAHLPPEFGGITYHWQLSNSAGHAATAPGVLKAHVWFMLSLPYTSAELRAWRNANKLDHVDPTLFNELQAHYTARPKMAPGVVDPLATRSGFVPGWMGDEVPLIIDASVLRSLVPAAVAPTSEADAVVRKLHELGLVRNVRQDGSLNIVCPCEDAHTDGKTSPSGCVYYPAHTGGYSHGNFKCQHASCTGRPRHLFTEALGITVLEDSLDLFDDVVDAVPSGKKPRAAVPEAQHLCTDQANVQRLLRHFGSNLLVASDRWFAWDGTRWVPDDTMATRYALTLSKIIGQEAKEWEAKKATTGEEAEKNSAIAKALKGWATKGEMRSTIDAALALAKRVLVVEDDLLDKDPWLLNCPNGTVDMRTGDLLPHDPGNYITKICDTPYVKGAASASFEQVLLRVCCEEGGPSPVANFLRRWFGYCATASTREQKFVVHYGLGSNGKSTIIDIISEVLGDYAGTAAPGLLVAGGKDRHPTEIADLFGRRMVTAHENSEGGVLREDFIKQATGGDRIKARFMRADFFEFAPTHKLQLLTNHKPVIKGQDYGIWRRVVMVPYKARFGTPEEVAIGTAMYVKDLNLMEKLRAEKQGVLAWVVAGAVEWYRDGLNCPDYVLAASGEYQKEQDRILHFIDENCDLAPQHNCVLTEEYGQGLFQVYEGWCKESGFFSLSKTRFVQELERLVPGFMKRSVKVATLGGRRRDVLEISGVRLMA